ncbi:MAG: CinA family nicotinamide mononucleotide deamidase-related protein [Rhizobiales bacterium]|nr:CinA family nicotinamide mononucleotide deamidase-related protein [Hyphomicrobiales bacterium]
MRIELICTGDEVLSGKIVNTNFSHISRRLDEVGLDVIWGTTVGDDRARLLEAFKAASGRADAVIVNGGLGPTVDDLSQEVAAEAAGDTLEINQEWLERMERFFAGRGRPMPENNRKQAMLPTTSEMIDNPVGTACGFALDIGKARFFFTPGVPRELHRMLDEEIIPRLTAMTGGSTLNRLHRFHSFGIGESRADALLDGVVDLAPDGGVKLGFQAHYPQLETKLAVRGASEDEVRRNLEPVESEVRRRLGNFVLAEGDDTLEGVILSALADGNMSVAVSELATNGLVAGRLASRNAREAAFRRALAANRLSEIYSALSIDREADDITPEAAQEVAQGIRALAGATHGLAVLVDFIPAAAGQRGSGKIEVAVATADAVRTRSAEIVGDEHRARLGAVEMGLDCLRRHLKGLPIEERVDFEKT